MSIGMKINEYITETIQTKKGMRRRINQLDEEITNIKKNNEKLIKDKDMYKTKLRNLKKEYIEYKIEAEQIIDELTKELKNTEGGKNEKNNK